MLSPFQQLKENVNILKPASYPVGVKQILCGNSDKLFAALKIKKTSSVIASYLGLPVIVHKGLEDNVVLLVDSNNKIISKYLI